MKKFKKKKLLLILTLIIVIAFAIIFNKSIFSYAKYAYNSTREYFLKSKGFYFYSDSLDVSSINNSNSNWDGGSTFFYLKNSLNDSLITDYDINYDVGCGIEGDAANFLECDLNGTNSNKYNGTLSAVEGCQNDTNDQVNVSEFDKTTCELNGYIWSSQIAQKEMYFNILNNSNEYKITEVIVNIKATSSNPYKKTLYGRFVLEKNDSQSNEIILNYAEGTNINKLTISNPFSERKCLKLTWDSNYVSIGEDKTKFNSFETDENGYINEINFMVEAKSELSYSFYERLYGSKSDLSTIKFNATTEDLTYCS